MTTAEAIPVEVPDIGDFEDVPIIEILVSPGDTVAADDPLLTLESDKATMDVPAPFAGTVKEIKVEVGDKVSQGAPLLTMERADEDDDGETSERASAAASEGAPSEAASPDSLQSASSAEEGGSSEAEETGAEETGAEEAGAEEAGAEEAGESDADEREPEERKPEESERESETTEESDQVEASGDGTGPVYASPSVRRLAREMGVDLGDIQGSGRKGRITKADVEQQTRGEGRAAASDGVPGVPGLELAPWPIVDHEKFGPVERVDRGRIKKISAPNLARNWVMIPHVTHNDEADITDLEAWRKQLNREHGEDGVKVTMVSFLVLACVASLKEFPEFNSSLDGEELVRKRYYNIGFAADTPGGLVVPVIKDADRKGLLEVAKDLAELSGKAREGKLGPAEMTGSTFTISSLGGIGGTSFTPIINAPEVAILGVTRAALKPVWSEPEEKFLPRLMLPLSLSYDHRVIDGAAAARFVVHLGGVLGDLRRALL